MDSIIFDVDGTLWDSTGIVAEAWSDYLIHTEHMDTDVSAKRLMGLFGQLLPDIAKALFPELPEAEHAVAAKCVHPESWLGIAAARGTASQMCSAVSGS